MKLTHPTFERLGKGEFGKDAWVVFMPTGEADFAQGSDGSPPRLLVAKDGAFNATKERWTFGVPTQRRDRVHILYFSHVATRSVLPRVDQV